MSRANAEQSKTTQMRYGIGPDTDVRYDHHLFLAELRHWVAENGKYAPDGLSRTLAFLNRSIPEAYRHLGGYAGNMTREGRLTYGVKHTSLPSLRLIMADPYIGALKTAPAKLSTLPTMKPKAPVSIKVYTNENLLKLTAANFLKLTAAQRARLMELRKAGGAKVPKKPVPKKPSPKKTPVSPHGRWGVHISPRHLRGAKFNRLVAKFEIVNHDRNVARVKAENVVTRRIMMGRSPFSPSPVKSKKKTPVKTPVKKTVARPRNLLEMMRSPGGRLKLKGPMGRLVYASGMSLQDLRDIAGVFKMNTHAFKTKAEIAEALFSK